METLNTHARIRVGTNSLEDYCASNYTTRAEGDCSIQLSYWSKIPILLWIAITLRGRVLKSHTGIMDFIESHV